MGVIFGHFIDNGIGLYMKPDEIPHPEMLPVSDPSYGFPCKRKKKCSLISLEEAESAKIPLKNRDYCAEALLPFMVCRKENWPFAYKCHHQKHAYLNCLYSEYVDRIKEWERERRLMVIAKKTGCDIPPKKPDAPVQ